jgi:hypothetical protein
VSSSTMLLASRNGALTSAGGLVQRRVSPFVPVRRVSPLDPAAAAFGGQPGTSVLGLGNTCAFDSNRDSNADRADPRTRDQPGRAPRPADGHGRVRMPCLELRIRRLGVRIPPGAQQAPDQRHCWQGRLVRPSEALHNALIPDLTLKSQAGHVPTLDSLPSSPPVRDRSGRAAERSSGVSLGGRQIRRVCSASPRRPVVASRSSCRR